MISVHLRPDTVEKDKWSNVVPTSIIPVTLESTEDKTVSFISVTSCTVMLKLILYSFIIRQYGRNHGANYGEFISSKYIFTIQRL